MTEFTKSYEHNTEELAPIFKNAKEAIKNGKPIVLKSDALSYIKGELRKDRNLFQRISLVLLSDYFNMTSYAGRKLLAALRCDPEFQYKFVPIPRAKYQPKAFRPCTPEEKVNDALTIRQFDLKTETKNGEKIYVGENYLRKKLRQYIQKFSIRDYYILGSIVENFYLKNFHKDEYLKGPVSEWKQLEESTLSDFMSAMSISRDKFNECLGILRDNEILFESNIHKGRFFLVLDENIHDSLGDKKFAEGKTTAQIVKDILAAQLRQDNIPLTIDTVIPTRTPTENDNGKNPDKFNVFIELEEQKKYDEEELIAVQGLLDIFNKRQMLQSRLLQRDLELAKDRKNLEILRKEYVKILAEKSLLEEELKILKADKTLSEQHDKDRVIDMEIKTKLLRKNITSLHSGFSGLSGKTKVDNIDNLVGKIFKEIDEYYKSIRNYTDDDKNAVKAYKDFEKRPKGNK